MSKATVVSLEPLEISDHKPGLYPGYFSIPGAPNGGMSILHISNSVQYIMNLNEQQIPVETPAERVAESLVSDFIRATLGTANDAKPGIFWVEGHLSKADIESRHADLLKQARSWQTNWYKRLVRIADDEWSKHKQHRMITDMQRHAARLLGVVREWMTDEMNVDLRPCPLCRSRISVEALICPICRSDLRDPKKG